ncbi:MAG: cytochrome c [Proteobacteria bacterium]|nr:cytochrome c [Pseudomonadota bacterium]
MKPLPLLLTLIGVTALTAACLSSGCQKDRTIAEMTMEGAATGSQPSASVVVPPMRKDGARAWAQNCMRCHNIRDPQERSDREWETIVHHMRVRANLTAEEHRLILEFLKAAN